MNSLQSLACAAVLSGFQTTAIAAEYAFGQVHGKPGERVRMSSQVTCAKGTVQKTKGGLLTHGTISVSRESELVWTFREPEADGTRRGMVRVPNISNTIVTTMDGKTDQVVNPSPLNGKLIEMSKSPKGEWKFELDGSVPLIRVEDEIETMGIYLKRKWYPEYKVKLGDSWEFDPVWIKSLMTKDLKKAKAVGTMRLRQVRHAPGGQTALIDVTIRSSGGDFKADGTETDASVVLDGSLIVNLETMLEESLELNGTIITKVSTATESHTTNLPITAKVTKSFVR
jgi:hypothetical protein